MAKIKTSKRKNTVKEEKVDNEVVNVIEEVTEKVVETQEVKEEVKESIEIPSVIEEVKEVPSEEPQIEAVIEEPTVVEEVKEEVTEKVETPIKEDIIVKDVEAKPKASFKPHKQINKFKPFIARIFKENLNNNRAFKTGHNNVSWNGLQYD